MSDSTNIACPNCGRTFARKPKFCPACGVALGQAAPVPVAPDEVNLFGSRPGAGENGNSSAIAFLRSHLDSILAYTQQRPITAAIGGGLVAATLALWVIAKIAAPFTTSSPAPVPPSAASTNVEQSIANRQWTEAIAWKAPNGVDDAIKNCRNWTCVYDVLGRNGASSEMLDFLKAEQRSVPTDDLGYPTAFRGNGKVKEVEIWEPGIGQEGSFDFLFVNGPDGILRPKFDIEQLAASSDQFQRFKSDYPQATPWPDTAYKAEVALPDGGQQFQFKQSILDGCHACAVLGTLEIGINFDATGNYTGVSVLRVAPDQDAAYGALADDLSQKTQYFQTMNLTEADGSVLSASTQTIVSETSTPARTRCQFSVNTNPNMTSGWFTLDQRFNLADVQVQRSSEQANALNIACNNSAMCISPVYSDARGAQPNSSSVTILVSPERLEAVVSDFQKLQRICGLNP